MRCFMRSYPCAAGHAVLAIASCWVVCSAAFCGDDSQSVETLRNKIIETVAAKPGVELPLKTFGQTAVPSKILSAAKSGLHVLSNGAELDLSGARSELPVCSISVYGMGPDGKDAFECDGCMDFPGYVFRVSSSNVP